MNAKIIDKEMQKYFMQLNDEQKKSVVGMLKTFLKGKRKVENELDVEEYNREIDEAVARVDTGEFYTQAQVEEMSKTW